MYEHCSKTTNDSLQLQSVYLIKEDSLVSTRSMDRAASPNGQRLSPENGEDSDSAINTPHRRRRAEERGPDRRSVERGRDEVAARRNNDQGNGREHNGIRRETDDGGCTLGLRGWRRKCLYTLLLFLTATVTLNLALTLFFMRVLDFSTTGLGPLQIVKGGLVATAPVHVMDTLVATHLSSRRHLPLTLLAAHNVSIAALDGHGRIQSALTLAPQSLTCRTEGLVVRDPRGRLLFSASKEEVVVGARRLVVAGEGGAAFSGSVQTGHVTAPVGKALLLESTTRALVVSAPQGVTVESRAGSISAHCLGDLTLQSTGGIIKLATSKVVVKGLPTSTVQDSDPDSVGPDVYQVCVCSGGRIFLAAPGGVCAADRNFCK